MKRHPFLENSSTVFPSQNVPLSKRTDEWKKENMDAAEFEAKRQIAQKGNFQRNYDLANDKLITSDYGVDGPNFDVLKQLTEDSGIPDVIRNYGIISQPIATLEGEMDNFPDVFTVRGRGDIFESEKERVQSQMLKDWFVQSMNRAVQNRLLEMQGDDPDAALFEDEEKYQEAFQGELNVMYPAEIQKFMKTKYKHVLEMWGQYELKDQFERFRLRALRRRDFHHWLRVAQRFRHLYVTSKGLKVESLNPKYVFCKKSPNKEFVQDGDLAGFVELLSVPAIIDRFGDLMTEKQLNSLETPYESRKNADVQKRPDGSRIDYLAPNGLPYQTRVMSNDPDFYRLFPDMMNTSSSISGIVAGKEELSKIDGIGAETYYSNTHLLVTTAYWKSQRRKGKLNWINPVTQLQEIVIVDETFEVPSYIKQYKNEKFNVDKGINTLVWTRETEIWQGYKISNYGNSNLMDEPIYLDIKPAEIQIGKLPIGGHFANNINTTPTSLVDKIESWQWFFNVLINQSVLYIQTEILPFAMFASDMIPIDKDWGGDQALAKWMAISNAIGANVVQTGADGTGRQDGGQYPRIVDLDRGSRVLSRINLALQIKQLALEHIGMSPQRMGAVKASETASGVNQAVSSSGVQTSFWFTSFFEGEREMLQLQLDAAKYLQAKGRQPDIANKSELSLEALRMALDQEYLYDLHVYVTDSQEELKNLQMARQLAIENNTSEMAMSDRLKLSTSSSIQEILEGLKESEAQMMMRRDQEIQLKQQELQQQGLDAQAAREQAERQYALELENKIQVALINAMGRQKDTDVDDNGVADLLEYNKILNTNRQIENQNSQAAAKLELDKQKHADTINLTQKQIAAQREQNLYEMALEREKLKRTTVAGDKSR